MSVRKNRSKFPSIKDLIPYGGRQIPHMFELVGVKPGAKTTSRLIEAAFADKTVVLTVFSTLALDLQDQPLELSIAKFREIMVKAEEWSAAEESLLDSLKKMTLASAGAIDFDAAKIMTDRFKHVQTNPIGQCRVYVQAKSLTNWTLKLEVRDQRERVFSPSHDVVVYRNGTQLIGNHGSWMGS